VLNSTESEFVLHHSVEMLSLCSFAISFHRCCLLTRDGNYVGMFQEERLQSSIMCQRDQ